MIASALSKFHSVRAAHPATAIVATAVAVASSPKQDSVVQPAVTSAPAQPQPMEAKSNVIAATSPTPSVRALPKAAVYHANSHREVIELTPAEVDRLVNKLAVLEGGPLADPSSVAVEMPAPAEPAIDLSDLQKGTRNLKFKWVNEGYFDAGYERLIGTFSTQMLRYGVRYGDDDIHLYIRNETLDTRGTGLPYPQAVVGTSVGLEARHWFPGNKMYAVVSMGDGVGGLNQGKTDTRYGLAGYTSWANDRWFGDLYGELFYIALAGDTFFDWRLRSGRKIKIYKDRSYLWDYVVGQFWVSGQTESGTENRMEFGPGIGYMFRDAISVNLELRAGYAFRTGIDDGGDRVYWNPTFIIAGGWYKGWP